MAKALDKIQGEEQAYLGSLLPIIAALIMVLHDFDNKPLVYCRLLVEALQNGMKKRFGKLMDDLDVLLAAAFHPQFRLFWLEQLDNDMEGKKINGKSSGKMPARFGRGW